MKKWFFIAFILLVSPLNVNGQKLQLLAGFGKHELINAKELQVYGNKFKGTLMQLYALNGQIEPVKRLWIVAGIGVTHYRNLVYGEVQLVNRFRLQYLSIPISIQYEVFRNFKIFAGFQWNIRPRIDWDSTWWQSKLFSPVRIYYYGVNYTLFDAIEVGIVQQRYMNAHLWIDPEYYNGNLYKQKSWYAYVSYVYRFGRKAQSAKHPENDVENKDSSEK